MIRALLFDCFGVVASGTWPVFCERHFAGDDAKWHVAHDLNRARDAGYITEQEYHGELAMLTGIEPERVRAELYDGIVANEPLMRALQSYKATHRIGMVSNVGSKARLEMIFSPEQLALFDELVLSGEVGFIKPDPRIYELAAARLGVLPEECVFVDDLEHNVIAAREVGMEAAQYHSASQITQWLATITAKAQM